MARRRTNAVPVHWRIYAALGGDELIHNRHPIIHLEGKVWDVVCHHHDDHLVAILAHNFQWDVTTHPCLNFKGSLATSTTHADFFKWNQ